MIYDFDKNIDRRNTNSKKWNTLVETHDNKDILPMWVADMDFRVAKEIIDAFKNRISHGIFGYDLSPDSLYQSIVDWIMKRHDWNIKKEWIVLTPGVVPGLNLAALTFVKAEEKIIIQPPIYPPFFGVVKNNQRTLVENPLKFNGQRYVMDFEGLEKKIDKNTKMLLLCSPHNPVGRVWDKKELERLGDICIKNNILIVSDEIHSDIIFSGYKHIPIASMSKELMMNTVTLMSPSKTFNIAGLYTSFAIIPNEELRLKYEKSIENLGIGHTNIFGIEGLEAAYNFGEEWLEQVLEYIEENLNFAIDYINKNISKVKFNRPEGTFLVWLDFRELGLTQEELNDLMIKKGNIFLNDGITFGKEGEGFLRLNIACPRNILEDGLKRIEKAINSIK